MIKESIFEYDKLRKGEKIDKKGGLCARIRAQASIIDAWRASLVATRVFSLRCCRLVMRFRITQSAAEKRRALLGLTRHRAKKTGKIDLFYF